MPGWFQNLEENNQFEIDAFQNAVAKQLNVTLADVGVITAEVRESFNEKTGIPVPSDEPSRGANSKDATPPADATVVGKQIEKRYLQAPREFGVLRSVISIR